MVNGASPAAAVAGAGARAVGGHRTSAPESRKPAVSVRLAQTEADLAAMIALGRVLHTESRY